MIVLPNVVSFEKTLAAHGHGTLRALRIDTLQVNVGKLCNQTCTHCHVDAGPTRTEIMTRETAEAVLDVVRRYPELHTVDITGGAPEMNPYFEYLVEQCRAMGRHVMYRCNLSVFFVCGKEHLPQFLAEHQVEVIASLPCYLKENVDQQRGKGVYDRSIAALQALNTLGYGREGTGLVLNLVYNPLGPKLPPPQAELEADYRDELAKRFSITFNRLYTITNMPINRFLDDLHRSGQYEAYMETLVTSFNTASVGGLMCRNLISVSWDGRLYDCDFNQMLDLPVAGAGLSALVAKAMLKTFSAGLIQPGIATPPALAQAILVGAMAWVLVASRTGLPVSTSHALTGALVGAGLMSIGSQGLAWPAITGKIGLPLLLSPVLALAVSFLFHPMVRLVAERWEGACLCLMPASRALVTIDARGNTRTLIQASAFGQPVVAVPAQCDRAGLSGLTVGLDSIHWLSSGLASLARGANDTPKIMAMLLLGSATVSWPSVTVQVGTLAAVALAKGLGSYIGGVRVTEVVAEKGTRMDHAPG